MNSLYALRPAYGYTKGRQVEGTDSRRIIVIPFCSEMNSMANYVVSLLQCDAVDLGVSNLDLSCDFNSCVVLLYYCIKGVKMQSSLGMHIDVKYSNHGVFLHNRNTQKENTPAVIITIGKSRYLKWKEIYYGNDNKRKDDSSWIFKMLLEEGIIFILHPNNECPHLDELFNRKVKLEHGNVNIGKDDCSVAFVFRVVPNYLQFVKENNCLECTYLALNK